MISAHEQMNQKLQQKQTNYRSLKDDDDHILKSRNAWLTEDEEKEEAVEHSDLELMVMTAAQFTPCIYCCRWSLGYHVETSEVRAYSNCLGATSWTN